MAAPPPSTSLTLVTSRRKLEDHLRPRVSSIGSPTVAMREVQRLGHRRVSSVDQWEPANSASSSSSSQKTGSSDYQSQNSDDSHSHSLSGVEGVSLSGSAGMGDDQSSLAGVLESLGAAHVTSSGKGEVSAVTSSGVGAAKNLLKLAEARELDALVELSLAEAQLGAKGARLLVPLLSRRPEPSSEFTADALSCLTSLNISDNDLGEQGGLDVMGCLRSSFVNQLTHLDFGFNSLGHKTSVALGQYLAAETCALQWLSLMGNPKLFKKESLGDKGTVAGLTENTSLAHLNISKCGVGTKVSGPLGFAIRRHPSLAVLEMANNKLTNQGAELLFKLVSAHPKLAGLDVRDNQIGDKGAVALSKLIECSAQRVLMIDASQNRGIKGLGGTALASALAGPPLGQGLQNLAFDNCSIGASATDIFEVLAAAGCSLLDLSLQRNGIPSASGPAIVKLIAQNRSLRRLNLAGNDVKTLPGIESSLPKNTVLETLVLRSNPLDIRTARALATAITNLQPRKSALRRLDLRQTPIRGPAFEALKDAFCKSVVLQSCWVGTTMFVSKLLGGLNLRTLPDSIPLMTHLLVLDLQRNSLKSLPEAIGSLVKLRDLNLAHNELTHLPLSLADMPALRNLQLEGNRKTLLSPPPNVVRRGRKEILGYLKDLQSGSEQVFRCKIMVRKSYFLLRSLLCSCFLLECGANFFILQVVGQENVGKTSFIRTLSKKKDKPGVQLLSTDGIQIDSLKMKVKLPVEILGAKGTKGDKKVQAVDFSIWDFAGLSGFPLRLLGCCWSDTFRRPGRLLRWASVLSERADHLFLVFRPTVRPDV
jgi:Leucine-rich repeat (LRR) protein